MVRLSRSNPSNFVRSILDQQNGLLANHELLPENAQVTFVHTEILDDETLEALRYIKANTVQ